jgi:hypothetical protein
MNVEWPQIDGVGDALMLLVHAIVAGIGSVLGNWWGPTVVVVALVVIVSAYVSDMGFTDYDDPIDFTTTPTK